MFDSLSLREKIMIFIGVIILLLAVYYFYFYQPLSNEITKMKSTIKQKQENIDLLKNNLSDYGVLQTKYDKLNNKIKTKNEEEKEINKYDISTSGILKFLNDVTEETKITMKNFRPVEDKEKLEINFVYGGTFYETIKFFEKIDKFQSNIGYNFLNINKQGEELNCEIRLLIPKRGDDDE